MSWYIDQVYLLSMEPLCNIMVTYFNLFWMCMEDKIPCYSQGTFTICKIQVGDTCSKVTNLAIVSCTKCTQPKHSKRLYWTSQLDIATVDSFLLRITDQETDSLCGQKFHRKQFSCYQWILECLWDTCEISFYSKEKMVANALDTRALKNKGQYRGFKHHNN